MSRKLSIEDVQQNPSMALNEALSGNEVIITSEGEPLLKIVRMDAPKRQRKPGLGEGRVVIHDNFDDPLPEGFWLGEE